MLKTLTNEAPMDHWGRKCAILTPNFGYFGPKVKTPDFDFSKILMMIEDYWVTAKIDGETDVFPRKKWPKLHSTFAQHIVISPVPIDL